jgi:hypothetical protein
VLADFSLIYDREFDALLSSRDPKSYLAIFADTCHSGGLPRGRHNLPITQQFTFVPIGTKLLVREKAAKTIPLSRCRRHKMTQLAGPALRNVIYFSGCKASEFSYDAMFNGRANGAMTYYLLKAFRERKAKTTFGQLFQSLAGKKGYLPNADYDQTPTVAASAANLRKPLSYFARAA